MEVIRKVAGAAVVEENGWLMLLEVVVEVEVEVVVEVVAEVEVEVEVEVGVVVEVTVVASEGKARVVVERLGLGFSA